jgi:hypothetical protein
LWHILQSFYAEGLRNLVRVNGQAHGILAHDARGDTLVEELSGRLVESAPQRQRDDGRQTFGPPLPWIELPLLARPVWCRVSVLLDELYPRAVLVWGEFTLCGRNPWTESDKTNWRNGTGNPKPCRVSCHLQLPYSICPPYAGIGRWLDHEQCG